MARIESRGEAPSKAGGVISVKAPSESKCRCGKKAIKRLRNAWRISDVCASRDCYKIEYQWVGNYPHLSMSNEVRMHGDVRTANQKFNVRSKRDVKNLGKQWKTYASHS